MRGCWKQPERTLSGLSGKTLSFSSIPNSGVLSRTSGEESWTCSKPPECAYFFSRKTGQGEDLFFDGLKLLSQANPEFSIVAISGSILNAGSALLALFTAETCIPSKNKSSPCPVVYFIRSNWERQGVFHYLLPIC